MLDRSVASVQSHRHMYTGSQTQLLVWSQATSISVRMIQFGFFFFKVRANSVPSTPIWDFSEFIQENQWKKL